MKQRFRFEKLAVWQEARRFKREVYQASRGFPKDEMFALVSQLRRAVISVASNIAEGSGRNSDKDFAHFLEQAYGSLMETASLLFLAFDEQYIAEPVCDSLLEKANQIAGQLVALNRSLDVTGSKTPFARKASGPRPSTLDPRLSP